MPRYEAGNAVRLLKCGDEFFPALEAAIDAAQSEVHLQTYIFARDAIGQRITAALLRAVQRGVAVRTLIDDFGSDGFQDSAAAGALREAGARVLAFRPWRRWRWFTSGRLRRMHRKLAVVDARVAFVGGINIQDDFDDPRSPLGRLDYAVQVEGPVLAPIHAAACSLWGRVSWSQFKRRWRPSRRLEPITNSRGEVPVAFLQRDHLHHRNAIEECYVETIASARDEVIVANAYFFPSRRLREALAAAVRRGVRVRLLLQGRAEYWFNHYASRALYADLLRAGVEIYEYTRSHLHAKVAVVDGEWMTVGSSNIEPFSLLLAKEANVVVNHARTATMLHDSLLAEMQTGARPVLREQWESLPLWERVQCRLALRLAHLALTLSTRGAERRFI